MKPGRELDALIAEKVMGIKDVQMTKGFGPVYDFTGSQGMPRKMVPNYSTNLVEVWEKAIQIHKANAENYDNWGTGLGPVYMYQPLIVEKDGEYGIDFLYEDYDNYPKPKEYGPLPYVICLAALRLIGVEI